MRNGQDYLAALDDGREVYVDGERVKDIASHSAFSGVAATVAGLYTFASDPSNGMQYQSPEIGKEASATLMVPTSKEELATRRGAITRWAEQTVGFMGRTPDHVGGFLAGFASHSEFFDRENGQFGENVSAFYRKVLAEDLYCSYVIIPPQLTPGAPNENDFPQAGVAEERDDGIVIRGAQMLGTSSAISDSVLVSCIKPLAPGEERYATNFVVPMDAPGLKLVCRRPYGAAVPSTFDYPLSSRFDETDALVIFDDVFVPWEQVFLYRDLEGLRDQWHATGAHVLGNTQAQLRLVVKLKFLVGLARHISQVNGIERIPAVQEKLADLASLASIIEGMTLAAESECHIDEAGVALPRSRFLYGAMGLQAELYPRVLALIRELAGAGVLQVPSSYKDFYGPAAADISRQFGTASVSAEERIKFFKLVWDAIGSEFASRHLQYEMFYAGAPFVAKGYAFRNYDFDESLALVDRVLEGYTLPTDDGM